MQKKPSKSSNRSAMTKHYQSFRLPSVVCLPPGKGELVHLTSKKPHIGSPRAGNSHSHHNQCQGFFFFPPFLLHSIELAKAKEPRIWLQVSLKSSRARCTRTMSALQAKQQQLRVGSSRSLGSGDGTGAPRSPGFGSFHRRYLGAGGPGGAMAASEQRWGGRAGAPCPLPQAEPGAGLRGRGAPGGRFLPSSRARAGGRDLAGRIPGRAGGGGSGAGREERGEGPRVPRGCGTGGGRRRRRGRSQIGRAHV